jgi:hypothetical protein
LTDLTLKELKECCKAQGLKVSGNKSELIERLKDPAKARAPSKRGMTTQAVNDALAAAGLKNPAGASMCARKGIQKGYITLEGGLDKVVFSGRCSECGTTLTSTLRDVLAQPDYAGLDYEDGGQNGALQCEECECGYYVTGMCNGRMEQDSGKFHNHCRECPGFGQCIGDYREAHCSNCGKHYFQGLSGFACTCQHDSADGFFDDDDSYYGGFY